MATITINIHGEDQLSLAGQENGKEQSTRVSEEHTGDGGAPRFESESASPGSASSQLDIGGPPQWLTDALSKEEKTGSSVSASGLLQGIEDGDAGAAKVSFN